MSLTRSIAGLLAGAALGADGARISRKSASSSISPKELAGVPMLNYDQAYGGRAGKKNEREHWVVVAKPGTSTATLEELCSSVKGCETVGHPTEGGVPYFEIHSTEAELEQVLASAPGQLEFVEPDGMFHLDPEESVETASSASWGLDRVDVPNKYATGKGTHIYVLDTGIRWTHQDFGGRASAAIDMTISWFGRVTECDGAPTCGGDVQGHGTHCAGTAGGNTFGVATDALIYSGKVLSDRGSGQFGWSYSALDWIAAKGGRPAISSMSLGGNGVLAAMKRAVDAAVDAGVTVVVAGGNSNTDACTFSPAFVPSAITVGSTDSTDKRSSFSNYGSCTEIWAPGSAITSAAVRDDSSGATFSGTSMACPHVSGGAALILEQNPSFKAPEVLADLVARSQKDAISDLKNGDVNKFLWVGSGPAPQASPKA